eukprot:CAMPEP_0168399354 /NCGR_PEP_ID=MMETSP0228-20121227/22044_1 /TAXON_ID=133427 /ORGANISM="Protoceratium reticulatum, Strain CCCM 535 (=CCMP 1889)" /LENGTH=435 /DNA_ID=CAMNT_0008412871 /DNA_START=61 /DNA_END=1365 /DNA_ORIENTATION=-
MVLTGGARAAVALATVVQLAPAVPVRLPALVSKGTATEVFLSELANSSNDARFAHFEEACASTFAALPKNSDGSIGHAAARYLLHRFFVQEHGWFVRGLEPTGNGSAELPSYSTLQTQDWLPEFLLGVAEGRSEGAGMSLRDVAALAAAIDDLAASDFSTRLEELLPLHSLPRDGGAPREQVESLMRTFFVKFLRSGNFTFGTRAETERKKQQFFERYSGWREAAAWLDSMEARYLGPAKNGLVDLSVAKRLAVEIGKQYYTLNDPQCADLKKTLVAMEGGKPGRVRLSTFYKKALYSHWKFRETPEYLRVLGALDESDPRQPQVIISNYAMSRSNCLRASGLYVICCRNACEDIMGNLEGRLGAPSAEPPRIAELVEQLMSETARAPGNLSAQLLERLDQVAAANGGRVPLHGRLFAQWMHHAFPRDCPYPHES